jgi:hypothetical protein
MGINTNLGKEQCHGASHLWRLVFLVFGLMLLGVLVLWLTASRLEMYLMMITKHDR